MFDPREGRAEAPEVPGRQAADERKLVAQRRDEDGDRPSFRRRDPGGSRGSYAAMRSPCEGPVGRPLGWGRA